MLIVVHMCARRKICIYYTVLQFHFAGFVMTYVGPSVSLAGFHVWDAFE